MVRRAPRTPTLTDRRRRSLCVCVCACVCMRVCVCVCVVKQNAGDAREDERLGCLERQALALFFSHRRSLSLSVNSPPPRRPLPSRLPGRYHGGSAAARASVGEESGAG